jgi:hypothetical protein
MSAVSYVSALTDIFQSAYCAPVVDVPFGSVTLSYSLQYKLAAAAVILVLQNFTNQILDYSLDGGATTTGHLDIGQCLLLDFKTSYIVLSASRTISFRGHSVAPSSGFASITLFSVS